MTGIELQHLLMNQRCGEQRHPLPGDPGTKLDVKGKNRKS